MKILSFVLSTFVLVIGVAATAPAQTRPEDGRAELFKYDQNSPTVFKEVSSEKRGDVVVRDITFLDGSVKAYLVVPPGSGPFAGMLWVHWLGAEKSNRTQFLDEAVDLAQKGVVSLLVDAMWATPRWFGSRILENDYENSIRQVIQLRRALDLLLSQSNVDRTRVGFVGHDYGAMYGMLMAGVEKRVKTYVFIAATQSLNDWAFLGPQPKSKAAYLKQNANLELTDSLRESKSASTFFQFGKADFYVSGADAAILFAAASEPKQRRAYDAPHEMTLKEIASDRDEWLVKELKLGKQE